MPAGLLDSLLATLALPGAAEQPIIVTVDGSPAEIVGRVVAELRPGCWGFLGSCDTVPFAAITVFRDVGPLGWRCGPYG